MSDDTAHDHCSGGNLRDETDEAAVLEPSEPVGTSPEMDGPAAADHEFDGPEAGGEVDGGVPPPRSGGEAALERLTRNMSQRGVLRIHHISRDVDLECDGFNALRVVSHFGRQSSRPGLDMVYPLDSDASNAWTALRYTDVVAITWIPRHGVVHDDEVVFDPY